MDDGLGGWLAAGCRWCLSVCGVQRGTYSLLVARPLLFVSVLLMLSLPLLNGVLVLTLGGCYVRSLLAFDGSR